LLNIFLGQSAKISFTLSFAKRHLFHLLLGLLACNKLEASYLDYIYSNRLPTFNSFGQIGIIQLPSGESSKEGNINFIFNDNDIYRHGALTISPFNWMEASYFYYRPSDITWKGSPKKPGSYLDKGFNVKFSNYWDKYKLHLAVGLDDFAGTGWFSKEYLAATHNFESFKMTLGIGWGKFVGNEAYKNPLSYISNRFARRGNRELSQGGTPQYGNWFRGPVSYFGGIEYFIPNFHGSKFKIEYDPFNYVTGLSSQPFIPAGLNFDLRKKKSDINFGFSIPLKDYFTLDLSFIKGDTLNITFIVGTDLSRRTRTIKSERAIVKDSGKGDSSKMKFYEDLIYNLNSKDIYLQTAQIDSENKKLKVAVNQAVYSNQIQPASIITQLAYNLKLKHLIDIDSVEITSINAGIELNKIKIPIKFGDNYDTVPIELVAKQSEIKSGDNDSFKLNEFRPILNFPNSFTTFSPDLVTHVGDPKKFFFKGLILRIDNETQFSRRTMLTTTANINLINDFDEKRNFPDSKLPNVRTDIVSYLQESTNYLSRLQLDSFFNPKKEIFAKFSAGILEDMYGGAGMEFLYKPFERNYSIGIEGYYVKKRAFDRRFDFLDYKTATGHLSLNYHFPELGFLGTLSYGKYLAGDVGFTLDISRRLLSGFRAGFFFTRTNVSADLFGEGSFDKGFYFQIPLDLITGKPSPGYSNFRLTPLTRDGGQKLMPGNDLIGLIHSASRNEIERDWVFFND